MTYPHTGRSVGITNYYWIKAIGTGYLDSDYDSANATPIVLTTLFEDDFTGTVINVAKWVSSGSADISITQNNELIFSFIQA